MEDKNSNTLCDSYTPVQLIDDMYDDVRTLLCNYGLNSNITKTSCLPKEEQKIFDDLALKTEILRSKLRKEYKNHK